MQPVTGNVHGSRRIGLVEPGKDVLHQTHQVRADTTPITLFVEPPQSAMLEILDQGLPMQW